MLINLKFKPYTLRICRAFSISTRITLFTTTIQLWQKFLNLLVVFRQSLFHIHPNGMWNKSLGGGLLLLYIYLLDNISHTISSLILQWPPVMNLLLDTFLWLNLCGQPMEFYNNFHSTYWNRTRKDLLEIRLHYRFNDILHDRF